jgi:hypothetical protein
MAEQFFPFTKANMVGGPARCLFAPLLAPVPTGPKDVVDQETPYTPKSGGSGDTAYAWTDFGATPEANAIEYSSNRTITDWRIQQQNAAVLSEVTQQTRTVKIPCAEITPQLLQIMENADEIGLVAAAAHTSAFDEVRFGSFVDLTPYRIAIVARRPKQFAAVTESGGLVRGATVVQVLYQCTLTGNAETIQWQHATPTAIDLELQCYPEPTMSDNQEHGVHWVEHAGTISGT